MARFGLDSDSDSDHHTVASTSRSPSPSDSPSASHSTRSRSLTLDHDDDAPPRESLYDDDDDMHSGSGDDDGSEDDDHDDLASLDHADDDSFSRSPSSAPHRSRSNPATRRPAATRTRSGDDADLSLNSPSPSPPPPPPTSRAHQQRLAWSSHNQPKLRLGRTSALEPKRAAVMQASLFHQHAHDDDDDDSDLILEPAALDRDPKRTRLADSPAPAPAPALGASVRPQPVPAIDPAPFRPHRTHSRPPLADSASARGRERNLVDAGLALGRSFRVGWGPHGELVSLNGVYSAARRGRPGEQGAASDSLKVDRVRLVASTDPAPALRLLKLQLAHSDIFPPAADASSSDSTTSAPLAVPSPDLRFSHYANLFSNPDSTGRSQTGSSAKPDPAEAQLFKLASVLFDEVPNLALPESDGPSAPPVTPQQRAHMTALRRRAQLSAWLEEATRPAVEAALQASSSSGSSAAASSSGAARVFALLSGHQVARACDAALESGNVRLATLVAQAGSGFAPPDAQLQGDLALQLAKWREYGVDAPQLVDPAYRRVLELVSGNVGVSEGRPGGDDGLGVPETHVLEGLTWVQALAAGLWYAPDPEHGDGEAAVRDAVEAYERAFAHDERVAQPVPAYLAPSSSSATTSSSPSWAPLSSAARSSPRAGTFHLLKLFASPVHALEDALAPRNFGTAPTDYRLTWHLYVLLSRVLRRRDWEDREVLDDEAEGAAMREEGAGEGAAKREGNSVTADRVTEAYAAQLEAVGEWDWAAFVLLHLELEDRRTKAIKNLLARHVDELADSTSPRVDFLLSTLRLPAVWLSSAQADAALCDPSQRFKAYTLLLAAQRAPEAHAIAWAELAPEALLRNDPSLVRRLLAPFHAEGDASAGHVAGWSDAGGVFVAYLDVLDRAARALPHALDGQQALDVAHVLARTQRLAQRARTEPRTRGRTQLRLALDDMVGRLVVLAKAAAGAGAPAALERAQPSLLPDSERAVWIQGANKAFWEASLARAVSA